MSGKAQLHYERSEMLFNQRRHDDAQRELSACLREDPEFAEAYSLLSLCMRNEGQEEEAILVAKKGVSLAPQSPFAFYCLGRCHLMAEDAEEAKKSLHQAIQLDPTDVDCRYILGEIYMAENLLHLARGMFLAALAQDAGHEGSLAALSLVEARLGNIGHSEQISIQALQNSPEDANAHVARGVSLLYSGQAKPAFEAFREALRLKPDSTRAREHMVQALQMNHFFYRWVFQFSTRMGKLSAESLWGLIILLVIVHNVVATLVIAHPGLAPVVYPLRSVVLILCLFPWIADPLTYALLWFNRWGRLAMGEAENLTGIFFTVGIVFGAGGLIYGVSSASDDWKFAGYGILLMTIPITYLVENDEAPDVVIYILFTSAMIGTFLFGLKERWHAWGIFIMEILLLGFLVMSICLTKKRAKPRF